MSLFMVLFFCLGKPRVHDRSPLVGAVSMRRESGCRSSSREQRRSMFSFEGSDGNVLVCADGPRAMEVMCALWEVAVVRAGCVSIIFFFK